MANNRHRMVCLDDFEKHAKVILPKNAFIYYKSGAGNQLTQDDNREAFKRYKILPRVLRDVSVRSMRMTILGHPVSFPVGIAPTAMQKMAHEQGEIATAKAAAAVGTIFTLSTYATTTIEDIVEAVPEGVKFFQLYIPKEKDRLITKDLLSRAVKAGFSAIVLTVDAPLLGIRYDNLRYQFQLPPHLKVANLEKTFSNKDIVPDQNFDDLRDYRNFRQEDALTWSDLKWLTQFTSLPVIVKGIMSAADAVAAVESGVAAVWVSNHGGRQLDTVPSTLDVLPAVVAAVSGRCEVYVDGGIRCGTDVFKALALGARAVFIGTPAIYGLVYDGEAGAKQVLDILKEEFSSTMALSGCANIEDITEDLVVHERKLYSKL